MLNICIYYTMLYCLFVNKRDVYANKKKGAEYLFNAWWVDGEFEENLTVLQTLSQKMFLGML